MGVLGGTTSVKWAPKKAHPREGHIPADEHFGCSTSAQLGIGSEERKLTSLNVSSLLEGVAVKGEVAERWRGLLHCGVRIQDF